MEKSAGLFVQGKGLQAAVCRCSPWKSFYIEISKLGAVNTLFLSRLDCLVSVE
jgi:hypothetical protein